MISPEMLAAKLEKGSCSSGDARERKATKIIFMEMGSCSSGDARERKATKLENAPVPIYLWEVAMDVARKCALRGVEKSCQRDDSPWRRARAKWTGSPFYNASGPSSSAFYDASGPASEATVRLHQHHVPLWTVACLFT
jgi:hypothetical protein